MSNYILDLRKTVGKRPLIQVGASVIAEDREGRILLQLRSDCHEWGYSGGSVELYEAVEETAKREFFEETGLIAEELTLLGIYSGPDMRYTYPNGDEVSNVDIVYICRAYSGELKCQAGEVEGLRFFSIDELPENLFLPNQRAIYDHVSAKKREKRKAEENN